MTEHDDVARMAADPATDWDTLHWIAENHPELRPDVAANPNTYPELLEALADLDDPAINAVLMRRFWPEDQIPVTEPEPEPEPEPAPEPEPEPEPAGVLLPGDDLPEDGRSDTDGAAWAAGGAAGSAGAGTAAGAPGDDEPEQHRRRRGALVLLAVLLPLVAVGAIIALGITLLGDRGAPLAEETPAPEPTTAEPEESPEPTPEEEPEPEGPTAEEARTALAELPGQSTCEAPEEDTEAFALLAEISEEEDSWGGEDEELVEETMQDLRAECGDPHAARVFQLLSGDEAEHEDLSATVDGMGIDWFNYAFPAAGAIEMTTFSSPTGNVVCEIGETLRCRVLQHSFEAPEGCEDGSTYRIAVDEGPAPDCDNPVSPEDEPQVLHYGQTAENGFFACASFQSQMSCWNQLTGEGINLSSTRNSIY